MRRPALWTLLLSSLLVCAAEASTTMRTAARGVQLRLARVPDREGKPVKLDSSGRFRLAGARSGTWTLIVTAPGDYLDVWVGEELKKRGWTRGEPPAKQVRAAGAAQKEMPDPQAGAHDFLVVAHDAKGQRHVLQFAMVATVENTNIQGDGGRYSKPMRWHHLKQGLSFKFGIGEQAGGIIEGSVERIVTVD